MPMVPLGALFSQNEIGTDPIAVCDVALVVEDVGCHHLLTYEYAVGANTEHPDRAGQRWVYTHRHQFHEPFVLFGYLAAVTRRPGLATSVIFRPQRQTVLVPK